MKTGINDNILSLIDKTPDSLILSIAEVLSRDDWKKDGRKRCLLQKQEQVAEMFRLMVFNILISNRDDHAKNFSFQWFDGEWKLSPAYDLLPSSGFNGYHTTTINGKGEPSFAGTLALATEVGLSKHSATRIIQELTDKCATRKMAKFKLR